ncbi:MULTISPECIES: phosphoglycerate dehydrogenase [Methylobacterium]|jgi:D-3-phosphoglycerate dehydrogenase|uniref:D-3-phosphoglycerate dehydrogenase n=1 Tax=Methylobacterium isbiliense TaxID=315478 RepID=A0ABQ4SB94_9HYPH|nr:MULTISPECIES: phosphoglycerate dehydrogenase [Methylobacterium]MBY0296706.1 phosphoglycerate dehydrogenase [Methylobacterium sp.]MDN3627054.1 phosphoglycerate dehydrogenase [Methylobacterium isbiliense]GJE00269.1 D-3-phosphoglycerate dehydrogenase [Methylobacterium isbiliense]
MMIDKLSLPKDKIRVLLLEGINDSAVALLNAAGYTNVTRLAKALDPADLREALRGTHILGIRSRTELDEAALEAADRLIAVGCFSVGTNQVDLEAARRRGIPVFNAPFSNTRSVAELVIGEIVMLLRRIVPRSVSAHAGGWDKSAAGSFEVRGKTLGIVGYGNIGSQLSNLAEAMGMRVIFHDLTDRLRHGNTEPVDTLDDLLAQSDVVSLHVPETPATHAMIGEAQIRAMKPGAYLINNSRGTVVDLDALAGALRDGHLRGAAVDVFPVEPKSNSERFVSPLQGLENVILTPHVGGSTEEAQERIGAEVARKLVDYSDIGSTVGAVNFPQVQLAARPLGTRYIHVQRNLPGMLRRLNDVFARQGINIAAQFYQTDGEIGYVVIETDAVDGDAEALLEEIRQLDGTIRARLLYERR